MKISSILFVVLLGMVLSTISVDAWLFRGTRKYAKDFYGGAQDMWRNYQDMKEANTIGADKYFHAKANYEAANRGPGGRHAAAILSNAREGAQLAKAIFSDTPWKDVWADYKADQEANRWGRNGGDPNKYRPNGLDPKYRK